MALVTGSLIQKMMTTAAATAIVGGSAALLHTQDRVAILESQRADDVARLDRIEQKIDRLLARVPYQPTVVADDHHTHNQ